MASSRVSTLELFFDLVFVFTITQVAVIVEHHPSWESTAQAALELLVIFWMYGGYAWLTNSLGTRSTRQRVVLLAGMAAFFVVSLSVPRAFGADGIAFGISYLVLNVVHLGGFMSRESRNVAAMLVIGRRNLVAAVLIFAAGFTHGSVHWPLWIAAVVVQYVPQLLPGSTYAFDINVDHFAERHGLMIIIVLGESLVSVALAATDLHVDARLVIGTLCGLASSAALWWAFFGGEDDAATEALRAKAPDRRGWFALAGVDIPTLLMIAAVVSIAAGSRLSLPELTEPTTLAAAGYVGGGAALYLIGLATLRAMLGYATPYLRLGTGLVLLATIPLGTEIGVAAQLAAVAVVIAVLLVAERRPALSFRAPQADRAG